MTKKTKVFTLLIVCMLTILVCSVFAIGAQNDYPNKPIRIILGVSPGGAMETAARQLQPYLEKELGVPLIIDCKPGAGGMIGSKVALESDPDGYVFIQMPFSFLCSQVLIFDAPFGFESFEIISNFITDPNVILVHKDSPWQSLEELVDYAKSQPPGIVTVGVCSLTDPTNLTLHALQDEAGVQFNIVPFGGGNPARMALAGKHTDVGITGLFASQHISEYVRVLGMAQEKNLFPDLTNNAPTINDALGVNVPYSADTISLFVPAGFSAQYPERAKIFTEALFRALNSSEYKEMLEQIGQTGRVKVRGTKESQDLLNAEIELWKKYLYLFEDYEPK